MGDGREETSGVKYHITTSPLYTAPILILLGNKNPYLPEK
jgi:hypothetical protein